MSSPAMQPIVVLFSDAVGGNPTQYMLEKAFAHHELDWRYLTVEVSPEYLGDAIRGIRAMSFSGGHCGNPHKEAVIPLLDRTTETAALVGAVNLLVREGDELVGDNTEGRGVVEALADVGEPGDLHIALLGAGRIARAIAVELAHVGVREVVVVDRRREHAGELAALLASQLQVSAAAAPWEGDFEVPSEVNLLINATSIGHDGPDEQIPIALDSLRPDLTVADVTPNSPQTWLLRQAAERGCPTIDGLTMYIDQMAAAMKIWTGIDPDRNVLREASEEFLEL